jgi:hypothetical protein
VLLLGVALRLGLVVLVRFCWGLFGRFGCCLCFRVCSFRTCAVGCSGVVVVRGFGAWVGRVGCCLFWLGAGWWDLSLMFSDVVVLMVASAVLVCWCLVSTRVWLLLFVLSGVFGAELVRLVFRVCFGVAGSVVWVVSIYPVGSVRDV